MLKAGSRFSASCFQGLSRFILNPGFRPLSGLQPWAVLPRAFSAKNLSLTHILSGAGIHPLGIKHNQDSASA